MHLVRMLQIIEVVNIEEYVFHAMNFSLGLYDVLF